MGRQDATRGDAPGREQRVPLRLQRFLARAGIASRRGSEDLITAGRVTVNGEVVTALGSKVDPSVDEVAVDGRTVTLAGECAYVILHKPAGYLTTMSDPQGRPTVAELVPQEPAGLFPVGRLDRDTTGLMLLTTDGDLAHRLLHPGYHVEKTYIAEVEGDVSTQGLTLLEQGVPLEDGMTAPASARIRRDLPRSRSSEATSVVELVIREGRKRQVRRMLEAVGHPVISLHRSSFGPLTFDDLEPGEHRSLTAAEVAALKRAVEAGTAGAEE